MMFLANVSGPDLPPMKETVKDGIKTLIEYKYNEEGKKIKVGNFISQISVLTLIDYPVF